MNAPAQSTEREMTANLTAAKSVARGVGVDSTLAAPLWRRLGFEGFPVMLPRRDFRVSARYTGWN